MKGEEEQPAHRKYDHHEEEINHDYIGYFVGKVGAEEVPALREEVEGKLLHVSLIDDEEEYSVERVLPNVFGDAIIEEDFEDAGHQEVCPKGKGQLEEEEIEIV